MRVYRYKKLNKALFGSTFNVHKVYWCKYVACIPAQY